MRISDWSSDVCSSDLFGSIAVGFGFAPSDSNNYLEDIAGDAALYLQNASDLLDTFTGSVSTGASVEGNVLTDGETTPGVDGTVGVDADEGGADGLSHLASITIGGTTSTEIGCASCRTRECQYVSISVVGGSLQQK